MKFRSLLLAAGCLLAFSGSAFSQTPQIGNSDFEQWETSTSEYAEPINWNSFKSASGTWSSFGGKQMNKSTQTRPGSTGSYSVVIWANTILGTTANGNVTIGQINMGSTTPTSSSNYNVAHIANTAFSEALGGYPDSLVVWVRSKITNVNHQPRIRAVIHDNYDLRDPTDAGSAPHIVGNATLNFTTTGNVWVRKSIPFDYSGPAVDPNYIMVTFTTCSQPGVGTAGDSLYNDDLELIYNPTASAATGTIAPLTYYVSAAQGSSVTVPFNLTGAFNGGNIVTAQLSDASGSFSSPVVLGTLATTTSGSISGTIPSGTATGSGYRIRVVASNPAITSSDNGSNIQIYKVSNSISPSSPQVICQDGSGTILSVSETPAGTSREWQYSSISGGSYNSFTPVETGTSYTPLFNITGTYYLVCQSVIGGITVTSQEVVITVNDQPVSGSLTESPGSGIVCSGTDVSAIANAGSGGAGTVTDILEYRYDGGTWLPYTSGAPLSTSGYTSVDIRTYRTASESGCISSTTVMVSWIISNPSSLLASNIMSNSADLSWTDLNGSAWNIEYDTAGFVQGNGTLITGTTSNPYNVLGLLPSTDYSFYVQSICGGNNSPWTGPYNFTTSAPSSSKTLNVKVFFEGLFNTSTGMMNQALGSSGPQFGSDIVDEITVELNYDFSPYAVAYTFNNIEVHTDGTLSITTIPGTISGSYYLVIKQRNSIETWSNLPLDFSIANPINYDFTTAASKGYGNNLKQTGTDYSVWTGDAFLDGIVDVSDMLLIDNASKPPALQGYNIEDINGDGIVDVSDMLIIDNNSKPPSIQALRP